MKRIDIRKDTLSDYELVIIPCNCMMEPISRKDEKIIKYAGIKEVTNYVENKYGIYNGGEIKDGDIRIIPGFSIKPDIMYVKFPFRYNDNSLYIFLNTISNLFEVKRQNGYGRTKLPRIDPANYGYTLVEVIQIWKQMTKEVKKQLNYLTKN